MVPAFTLRTLGSSGLVRTGAQGAPVALPPRVMAVLAFLATAKDGRRRDELMALLWGDTSQARARQSVSQSLYVLRQTVASDAVLAIGAGDLRVNPDCIECDVLEFVAGMAAGRFEDSIRRYHGDFLRGFHLPDAPLEFEQWVESERTRYRGLAADAARQLADGALADGRADAAVRWMKRAHEMHPFDEVIARRVIELLDAAGNRAGAVLFYREFEERLARELDLSPAEELRALAEGLHSAPAVRAQPRPRSRDPVTGLGASAADPPRDGTDGPLDPPARRPGRHRVALGVSIICIVVLGVIAGLLRSSGDTSLFSDGTITLTVEDTVDSELAALAARRMHDALSNVAFIHLVEPEAGRRDALARLTGRVRQTRDSVALTWRFTRGRQNLGLVGRTIAGEADADATLDELEQRVLGLLAIRTDSLLANWLPAHAPPPRLEAERAFAEGVAAFRNFRLRDMIGHFERAAADTLFLLPRLELLGLRETPADSVALDTLAAFLLERSAWLAPSQLQHIRAVQAWRKGWLEEELAAYREAARTLPARYAGIFAEVGIARGEYAAAAEALEGVDTTRVLVRGYRNWFAIALHGSSRHEEELELARATSDPDARRRLMRHALAALGRIEELDSLLGATRAEGMGAWQTAGNMIEAGIELLAHGHDEANAQRLFETAVREWQFVAAERPGIRAPAVASYYLAGQLDSARAVYQSCVDRSLASLPENDPGFPLGFYDNMRTETGGRINLGCLASIGVVAAAEGNDREARAIAARLAEEVTLFDRRYVDALRSRARIMARLGDRDAAVSLLAEALAMGMPHISIRWDAYEFRALQGYPPFERLMRGGSM